MGNSQFGIFHYCASTNLGNAISKSRTPYRRIVILHVVNLWEIQQDLEEFLEEFQNGQVPIWDTPLMGIYQFGYCHMKVQNGSTGF